MNEQHLMKPYAEVVRGNLTTLIGGKGHLAVYYMLDKLMKSLFWGTSKEDQRYIEMWVETDNTLNIKVLGGRGKRLFYAMPEKYKHRADFCTMGYLFYQCFEGITSGSWDREQWDMHNPYFQIFLAIVVAVCKKARVSYVDGSLSWSQSYKDGKVNSGVQYVDPEQNTDGITLKLLLDPNLLEEDLQAYPFKVRLREFAALGSFVKWEMRYKGFDPLILGGGELRALLDIATADKNNQLLEVDAPYFEFEYEKGDYRYRCILRLLETEMEKLKSFAGFDESYHGGEHEELVRDYLLESFQTLLGVKLRGRRQAWDNVACSRMTYFGYFGVTVPFQRQRYKNEQIEILPGLCAVIHVSSPELQWVDNHKSRVVSPETPSEVHTQLNLALRRWVHENQSFVQKWLENR